MTTTQRNAEQYDWLIAAASRLDAKGQTELAAEARAEAAAMLIPAPAPAPVIIRCDSCQRVVRSQKQIDKYETLGVDWALCRKCEA